MNPLCSKSLSRRGFLAGIGAAAAGFLLLPGRLPGQQAGGSTKEEAKLNFLNWDTYIGPTTLDDFKAVSGISVRMDLFADNDELFARLRQGDPGYDVVVPSNDFVERMIAADMLTALDHAAIPNKANLQDAFQDAAFDPGRRYSMPYMWGTMGIGYRRSACDGVPDSWKWLYDSERYKGRSALLSEAGSVLGAAFKYLGHPLNAGDPKVIEAAADLIIAQKPNIKVFAPDTGQELLLAGEVDIAMEWNGDILQAMREDPDISYVVPREGSILWEDTLAIPRGVPHPANAHRFIDFLLDAEVGAAIADAIRYATPNAAALALLPESYARNPAIFPPEETLAACETARDPGPEIARLYDTAWTRIMAA